PLILGNEKIILVGSGENFYSFEPSKYSFHDELLFAPKGPSVPSLARTVVRSWSEEPEVVREIDFRAYSGPDFSENKTDLEIVSCSLKHGIMANQYLKSLNLLSGLTEVRILREQRGLDEAIKLRDP